ncbi:DNA-binding LacI/PurR family transcriptional regulator [Rubricella aquisinus]|uniref:DNA-binding LacI/PurR family transcriptional regulator n=1 Tax=Rubricella aquisinus TaxID=2028108 RepID=A0A840WN80_9RHOB|nr:LacI family DNA-binding transcriptional regulator [Rubricella aquisinus]MBB5515553.1 DNA-binding LacI/PurR family transcriptional regulator [Rubricella aquisinus]
MNRTTVTSGDVARLAKVSQSAVSRTFTPGASVSAKTREKVEAAARELGYRPNALARAMISGRSRTIALLVAYLDNQFYPIVLEQFSRAVQDRGYRVLLFMTDPGNQDAVVEDMMQYQVEAVVMASATLSTGLAQECERAGIPVVLFNRYVPGSPASSVTTDNRAGGRLVADLFLRAQHERIAYIAGAEDSSTNRDREFGFLEGLAAGGKHLHSRAVGGYTFAQAAQAARTLFTQKERPDAVFVGNDHMAFAVLDVLRHELDLVVPREVSVVGFDNVPESGWKGYDLTTVEQPADAMIRETARILFRQLEERQVEKEDAVLPCRLIERGTTHQFDETGAPRHR